jgi:glycosyltransferase involved in cell wall biosynthesis
MPEISVIIPNYNHAKYLDQRIESVLQQTFRDFEIIILDDHSIDNSRTIIEKYRSHPKVKAIDLNAVNSGSVFRQWQKGIGMAKGNYIWIAESDDFAAPTMLAQLHSMIRSSDRIGIVFCNSNWVDEHGETKESLSLYGESFCRPGKEELLTMLKYNTIQNASAVLMVRKLAIESMEGIDQMRSSGDWLLYTRILKKCDIAYTGERLNYFRWYHNNVSNAARKKGLWTTEGVRVLLEVEKTDLPGVNKKVIAGIAMHWLRKIVRSDGLSFIPRLKSALIVFRFYFRFT